MDPVMLLPVAAFVLVFGIAYLATNRTSAATARLARLDPSVRPVAKPALRPRTAAAGDLRPSADLGKLARMMSSGAKDEAREKTAALLARAGSRMSVGRYLTLRAVLLLVVGPLVAILALVKLGLSLPGIGVAAVAMLLLPRLPAVILERRAKSRAADIEKGLPDALDLLVVCVEGGLSLDGALMQVATRTKGEVATELRRLQRDMAAGMGRRDAFLALAARSPSESLAIVCSSITQADKMGMSVATTLRALTETMRMRRRQAAEEKANKAPIKMMPVLVIFMIPSLFAVILGQAALAIMNMN